MNCCIITIIIIIFLCCKHRINNASFFMYIQLTITSDVIYNTVSNLPKVSSFSPSVISNASIKSL